MIDELELKIRTLYSRIRELESALKAIHTATRGDEHGSCWTIREWLNRHNIYNEDIGSRKRLVEEVCRVALDIKEGK